MIKPYVVPERSNANKRVANVAVSLRLLHPSPHSQMYTFEERAAVLTLTEQRWQSHGALAGLIIMAL